MPSYLRFLINYYVSEHRHDWLRELIARDIETLIKERVYNWRYTKHMIDYTQTNCPDCGRKLIICANTLSKCSVSPNNR